ncbi:MAG: thioredoxin domain-containing protein [Proteobacteria bacterium]|nr:thioredoxin domain-containing protein [Cystobacterineae bacterium]MCL2313865.1 thioredoxin domain-containing protein [Pseudomonadota bacterium]
MKVNAVLVFVVGLLVGFAVGGMLNPFGKKISPTPTEKVDVRDDTDKSKPPTPRQPRPPPKPSQTTYKVPIANAPVLGSMDALVTIVTFSDYQCPFCARLDGTLSQLQKEMSEKGKPFRIVMKQFPLGFHKDAKPAAMAALAAGAQGKYWQMHELLFKNIKALDAASLENYAKELGLNISKFKADLENATLMAQIEADMALGAKVGVSGTPASFINGRFVSGARPKEDLEALVEEEMLKAQQLVSKGTPADKVYEKILESALEEVAKPKPVVKDNIPTPENAPTKGPKNAPVTINIWSDFECPFCSKVNPTLHALEKKYAAQVKFVFRHLPLEFHKNAPKAAEASMAAHAQGKFWEMHDLLFANQKALDEASLLSYAQKLKLNVKKFQEALTKNTYAEYVKNDVETAGKFSIRGTPTFIINGQEISGAQPQAAFEKIIDAALSKPDAAQPTQK